MKTKPSSHLGPLASPKPHFNPVVPTPAALEPAAEKPPAPAAEPMKLTSGQVILLHLISRHDGTYLAQRAYRSIQQLLELKLIEDIGDESSNTVQHFRARITDAGRQVLIDADKAVGAPVLGAQAVQPGQEAPKADTEQETVKGSPTVQENVQAVETPAAKTGEQPEDAPVVEPEQSATEPFILVLTQSNFEFLAQRSALLEKMVAKLNRQRERIIKNAYWDRLAAIGSRNVASLLQKDIKDIKEQAPQIEELKAQIAGQAEKMAAQQATIDALCAENEEMRAAALGVPVAELPSIDPEIVRANDGDNAQSGASPTQSGVSSEAEVPPQITQSDEPLASSVTV